MNPWYAKRVKFRPCHCGECGMGVLKIQTTMGLWLKTICCEPDPEVLAAINWDSRVLLSAMATFRGPEVLT